MGDPEYLNEEIENLHNEGYSITKSMKYLVEKYHIPLSQAKELVVHHPIWFEVVKESEPLQQDVQIILKGKK